MLHTTNKCYAPSGYSENKPFRYTYRKKYEENMQKVNEPACVVFYAVYVRPIVSLVLIACIYLEKFAYAPRA